MHSRSSTSDDRPVGIITGASRGIGAATAVAFAREGARLVLAARSESSTARVAREVDDLGGQAIAVAVDVRHEEEVAKLAALTLDRFGRIDFLVANAGITDISLMRTGDPAIWRDVLETNVLGVAHCVRYVLPHLWERQAGHVFLIGSVSGKIAYAGEAIYIASKWALVGLAGALREELSGTPIRVTLVQPGIVDTPLTRSEGVIASLLETTEPLQPSDVAEAIVFAFRQPPHVLVSEIEIRPVRDPDRSLLVGGRAGR